MSGEAAVGSGEEGHSGRTLLEDKEQVSGVSSYKDMNPFG